MPPPIPDYSAVVLLLPMSGANGGTVFSDRSPVPKAVTRFGNTATTTGQSKYYGSSAYLDGSGDYFRCDSVAAALSGSTSFTVEGWFRTESRPGSQPTLFGFHSSAGANKLVVSDTNVYGSSFSTATWSPVIAPAGQWAHVACVRRAATIDIFVNGELHRSLPASANDIAPTDTFTVGQEFDSALSTGDFFKGHIQDVCVTLGEVYSGPFTPPARMIGDITGSVYDSAGQPVVRTVFAVPRSYVQKSPSATTSAPDGTYALTNLPACEYAVVALDDAAGETLNDLILRTVPA